MSAAYPAPTGGASLLLSFRLQSKTVLIIGANTLAASRAFAALEADSRVAVLSKGGASKACDELQWRAAHSQLEILDFDSLPCSSTVGIEEDRDAQALDAYLSSVDGISLVCITDTLLSVEPSLRRSHASANQIAQICRTRHIPVNVTDIPDLCDFTFTSTHRFRDPDSGFPTSLQIAVTTNGQGCRLGTRVRREIVASLPKEVGGAATNIGKLRALAKASDETSGEACEEDPTTEEGATSTPNKPVPQRSSGTSESAHESARRRMNWVAQVSEYWPFQRLARMSEEEMAAVLDGRNVLPKSDEMNGVDETSVHGLSSRKSNGKIYLVGSGPGHPSLLTLATHAALTKRADLVLSDKLVPAAVLALIPPSVEVRIARKFPGNADGAQAELMEAAIEAAKRGLNVVRLKQGDPTVYGRAGEEVLYFRSHGIEPIVIPGVTSALAGPTFAGIPVTQRGAAESFVVCTGVGRQGKEVKLPGYERSRTLLILMGVARLPQVLEALQARDDDVSSRRRNGHAYPSCTPIAIIERASMPDQRVVLSTLRDIEKGLVSVGEQRPPGMIVVGWSILSLWNAGDMTILDENAEAQDEERIHSWLGDSLWDVKDGLDINWDDL